MSEFPPVSTDPTAHFPYTSVGVVPGREICLECSDLEEGAVVYWPCPFGGAS